MLSGTIAFLSGILALQGFKELPDFYWLLIFCSIICVSFFYSRRFFNISIWLLAGFCWAWLHAWFIISDRMAKDIEGSNVEIQGYIASIPVQQGRLTRFLFDIESASNHKGAVRLPDRVRLNWYGKSPLLQVGDKWQLTVRLKRPHGFMNPGGFDYEKWLFSQRIGATGYVRTQETYQLLESHWASYPVQRLRLALLNRIDNQLSGKPMQGIITALILGYREGITKRQWEIFRQTGTNHLVAISGLHIGLVAGLVFFLSRWLWSRFSFLTLRLPAPQAAAFTAFMAAAIYAALAGWSLPTQRALIMVGVVMLAIIFKRHVQTRHGFALALLLVLLHDPLAVMHVGFWLSFGAVGLIFLAMQGSRNGIRWWNNWVRIQWVVGIGLLPLLILFFQEGSLISPVANFIAIPVISLLVVPLLMTAVLISVISDSAGLLFFNLAGWFLELLSHILEILGGLEYATWSGMSPHTGSLLLAILGILILLFSPVRSSRWSGLVLLLPLVFYRVPQPDRGEVYFSLLDVGQGLAVVIETSHHTLVFDTGPRFSDNFDTGSAVLVPFLRQRQHRYIDSLIISHGDNDHIGGIEGLLTSLPARQIRSSAPVLLESNRASPCQKGDSWNWDGVSFRILHPDPSSLARKENNQSCVLHIQSKYGSILLPGDIEKEVEYALVDEYGAGLHADILVAPHHGSKTSSTREFIRSVKPRYVLYPVGYRNRYKFPYQKVVQRFQAVSALAYTTSESGAIQFKLAKNHPFDDIKTTRQTNKRYWHHSVTE